MRIQTRFSPSGSIRRPYPALGVKRRVMPGTATKYRLCAVPLSNRGRAGAAMNGQSCSGELVSAVQVRARVKGDLIRVPGALVLAFLGVLLTGVGGARAGSWAAPLDGLVAVVVLDC